MKVLKPGRLRADNPKEMGALAVTTKPVPPTSRLESPNIRRAGIRLSVVGGLLTLIGAVTVLVLHDGSNRPAGGGGTSRPASSSQDGTGRAGDGAGATTATTTARVPPVNRATGTIGSGVQPGTGAPPQEMAELLAGLPLQLEQAANSSGQPHELTAEEVNKIVDDLLRQLGGK